MGIRDKIARIISPNLDKKAARYDVLIRNVDECQHWLSEFEEASLAMKWLKERDHDYWRRIDQPPIAKLPSRIDLFREYLRNKP